jgi:hypothetical protein
MKRYNKYVITIMMCLVSMFGTVALGTNKIQDEAIKVVKAVSPNFPALASVARISGKVVVEVNINSQGNVILAKLTEGHALLKTVSEDTARKWKFNVVSTPNVRIALITFLYTIIANEEEDVSPIFTYPFGIEIKYKYPVAPKTLNYIPDIVDDENIQIVCKIHKELLLKDNVPIGYGLITQDKSYEKAHSNLFPNSNSFVYGGCLREDSINANILYCFSCRQAEISWKSKNQK